MNWHRNIHIKIGSLYSARSRLVGLDQDLAWMWERRHRWHLWSKVERSIPLDMCFPLRKSKLHVFLIVCFFYYVWNLDIVSLSFYVPSILIYLSYINFIIDILLVSSFNWKFLDNYLLLLIKSFYWIIVR
jgi:hypothetical protein